MSKYKTKIPQVGRTPNSESHSDKKSDSLMDSGGGKKSTISTQHKPKYTHKIYIATYNIRTMRTENHLEELEQELEAIKWDIIGICETRLKGEKKTTLKSGHVLYENNSEINQGIGGVALIVNRKIKHEVVKYHAISNRVIYLVLKLNNKYQVQVIHCYAPTSSADDESIEQLYEDITSAKNMEKTYYTIITGDFNAKIGKRHPQDTEYVGNFGLGTRNERGETLTNYLNTEKLFCLNTFFKKQNQRRWTWKSADGRTKNEIDFILSNNKNICKDISVLNKFSTGSDHRLVRARILINTKIERKKLVNKMKFPTAEFLTLNKNEYENEIKKKMKPPESLQEMNIDDIATSITDDIQAVTKKICSKIRNEKETRLSAETKQLIKERRETCRDSPNYNTINKKVKKKIRTDIRAYKTQQIIETIEANKNMRVLKSKLSNGKQDIVKLKDLHGNILTNKTDIVAEVQRFYASLYTSSIPNPTRTSKTITNVGSEELPEITTVEITHALKQMKNRKAPGEDQITSEMLKAGGRTLLEALRILTNKCMFEGKIPKKWKNAEVIILHKKGDTTNIENYRPISLLSHLYKLMMRIITNRLTKKLDFYQPVEQAGFRKGFGTVDHLQTIRTLIEKTTEYNIPLHMAFIDYHKAFDSVETWAFLTAMNDARIDSRYTALMEDIYKEATFHVKINDDLHTGKINLNKGVRQGDPISPKLFTAAIEKVFKQLNWDEKGMKIDGAYLSHLRFADDIILTSTNIEELKTMIEELNNLSKQIGLKMNLNKTKIITSSPQEVSIENTIIEKVEQYTYLGHTIKIGKENQTAEIKRRTQLTWAAFGKLSYILKDKDVSIYLKRKVYNSCILPVATYGLETMAITKKSAAKLRVTQKAMERAMLGITLRDKVRNTDIRAKTKITDVMERTAELKWQWAGHVARKNTEEWSHKITFWRPRKSKRSTGRPQTRWVDDIKTIAGKQWMRTANDREAWKQMKEAYIQQWKYEG